MNWGSMVTNDVEDVVRYFFGSGYQLTELSSLAGGCISQASRLGLTDPDGNCFTIFWKRNDPDFLDNFQKEADGLHRLALAGEVATPAVLATGIVHGTSHFLTQWVETCPAKDGFFRKWGQALAKHHRATKGTRIGLEHDNYLGASTQTNRCPHEDWIDFVAQYRLIPQLEWANRAGLTNLTFKRQCQTIINELPTLLDGREPCTSLLHGDLWSGNWLCGGLSTVPTNLFDKQHAPLIEVFEESAPDVPVWIDPAVYYGCREAEFGMLLLFGGCPPEFYDAYQSEWPLPDGWQRRADVYVLYHLLNHLNLFGGGYRGSCETTAERLLRAI